MKIISKYKDYYDYFQGIYGIDNNKIFERRKMIKKSEIIKPYDKLTNNDPIYVTFAIGGKLYRKIYYKDKTYHTAKEVKALDELFKYLPLHFWTRKLNYEADYNSNNGISSLDNMDHRMPLMIKINRGKWLKEVPYLKSFAFHKILPAKEVYILIETFLGWMKDNPEPVNNQTDWEKIIAAGFDTKESFRNTK